ncbi:ABC transporter permease [Rhodanobacter sp. C01]|uniref:ABC transporter permease n=1 Tax=Rhodanobacter sp. C01 TaxID=1945856 RepID=UPI00267A6DEA
MLIIAVAPLFRRPPIGRLPEQRKADRLMSNFAVSPRDVVSSIWDNRRLLRAMIRREVLGRYRGSFMGILWSFFNPLLLLVTYTFVFSVVFKARWDAGNESKTQFAIVLFAGLTVFNLFAECINRAPGLILPNTNYVKKVVFPLEILPCVIVGSALFHAMIGLGVWLLAYLVLFGLPPLTALLLPLVIVPFILLILGLSWMLASLGVYLRDVSQFIGIATTVLMFLSPIFYPVTALPAAYRHLLQFNPVTLPVEMTRDLLIWGRLPDLLPLAIYTVLSVFVAWIGFAWFQKTKGGFADVL